jgi:multisubunit Na+/H+ antiporter MnhC subunit
MKPLAILGLILIALGLAALVYQGVSYSSRETVLDLGPIHATAEREKTIPLPPIMGITAVVAGVALLVVGGRKGK